MNQPALNLFLLGAVVMACAVIGLFFVRFWRKTHDRLFAIFAAAFWVLGLNWLALALLTITSNDPLTPSPDQDEVRTWLYVVRLLAFLFIVFGILDKNRNRGREG
ncbi:MAG: DUF5985 family protein [Tepidisphaeraceae bacterium]